MPFEGLILLTCRVQIKELRTKIRYTIIRYVPIGNISRRSTEAEINDAVSIAKKHFGNIASSLEDFLLASFNYELNRVFDLHAPFGNFTGIKFLFFDFDSYHGFSLKILPNFFYMALFS
jgi:hypothetical protein